MTTGNITINSNTSNSSVSTKVSDDVSTKVSDDTKSIADSMMSKKSKNPFNKMINKLSFKKNKIDEI